ncbi:MAG TPA: delta-60 repeat domain-containing protein [Chthoniobacterales bacterium]|nr:delta-60 repeat domain-containing protein [Chthoniobacterales bacterium]
MSQSICFSLRGVYAVLTLLLLIAAKTQGQSALDGFDPNPNGPIYVVVVQPDGRILLGGDFTTLSPNGGAMVTRNRLARLNSDGTLDTAFDPNSNGFISSLAVQADGKILVGGLFTIMSGQPRTYMARLDATTGLADSFNPIANDHVLSIAVQADGKILAGGYFTTIGLEPRNHIARLDPITGLADSFDPNANHIILSIAVQADGKILAGGYFSGENSIGGEARNRIARLDPTTGLADSFDPDANDHVMSIVQQPDGKILVAGYFTQISGELRSHIARFKAPTPAPIPTATPGVTPMPTPVPPPAAQAINLSTRMFVQSGDNVGIAGFIITGSAPKHLLLRGLGPSMGHGFRDVLDDPVLELHGPGGFATITNNNWRDTQEDEIEATGLPPGHNVESAIDATLAPGAYTAVVRGNTPGTGSALVEIYDLSQAVPAKLANISTRALVGTDEDIVIAGFILGGNSGDDRIVVRGIGPSLTGLGVPDALANPWLDLRDSNGAPVLFNEDWQDDPAQAAEISAAGLAPSNNLEAAMAATLPPGLYTALLFGENKGTGVGLVEVYDRGAP